MSASRILASLLILLLTACQTQPGRESPVEVREFQVQDLAKSDVDIVAEIQLRLILEHLESLMLKLYKRNPQEWKKSGQSDPQAAVARVFGAGRAQGFPELDGKRTVDAIRLAFDPAYQGDRILAFIEGLRSMVIASYDGKQVFYMTDELDPQKLYNAARNMEVAVWMLSNKRRASGQLYLLSNEMAGAVPNLSFERLFGKLIALQDGMAQIVAARTKRRIKNLIQSVASLVFLPI